MTRQDYLVKWTAYVLAFLPLWLADSLLLPWFPLFGVTAGLLTPAAITVAVLEGPQAGVGFGMFVGVVYDAFHTDVPGWMILALALLGLAAGLATQYGLRQNLAGCLVCGAAATAAIDLLRMAVRLLRGQGGLAAMAVVAGREILAALICGVPVYFLFRWVYRRVPKRTVL